MVGQINNQLRKLFYSQLVKISNLEIREFVKAILNNAPEGFWTTPCSGSGKYHPPENQGNGGLIRHLLKCLETAQDMCRYFGLSESDMDIVLAGVFLHDIKKNGDPWGPSTDMEHGLIGARFIEKFSLCEPAKTEIMNCVRYHLYRFTRTKGDIERASNPSRNELIVQLTDLFCSRKYASFLPGVNLTKSQIKGFENNFQANLEVY